MMNLQKTIKLLNVAKAISELSKDKSTKVGAIAIGPNGEIRAMGYNGFPRGFNDDIESRHERPEKYIWTEHAERNLIYNAARVGVPLNGCTLIVTPLFPCIDCARAIVQSGITHIISDAKDNPRWIESNNQAKELLTECNVTFSNIRQMQI